MPAKAHKRKHHRTHRRAHRATSNARRRTYRANPHHRRRSRRNPGTRVIVMGPRHNRRRNRSHRPKGRRNPAFFGTTTSIPKLAEYIAGGLIGVTINRAVLPMLPAAVTSNNLFAVGAAIAIAVAEWWAFSFVSKDFGSAVGFGGLMNAGSQALNAFIPSVGATVGLSGRRGYGDLVPSTPGLPFWPSSALMGGGQYQGMSAAYPVAYGKY